MSKFKFSVCLADEVDDLVQYIHENWIEKHILSTSRTLLDWQHKSKCGKYYNFIIVRNLKDNFICGVLGFIPTSHFSEDLEQYGEVWPVLWKVTEGPEYVGLGTALFNFLISEFAFKSIYSISISDISQPIYKKLGFRIESFNQIAIINSNLERYYICSIPKKFKFPELIVDKNFNLSIIKKNEILRELSDQSLYGQGVIKNAEYFLNRYIKHPVFRYRFFGIYRNLKLCTFLVTRVVKQNKRSVIRVVDIQGNLASITKITKPLHDILVEEGHEYIDIMQFGLPVVDFLKSGFVSVKDNKNLVIPDYFEPFMKINIDIVFAIKSNNFDNNILLFKGDSDQDRPNEI
jgi:hypothetical protein